jgi:1,4-dihydroxy-2-naphthoate octaprenyltransferase
MRAVPAPSPPETALRGLAWQHFEAAWRPRLGDPAWQALARDAGLPDAQRLDPFQGHAAGPFLRALALLDQRHGTGDGALAREAGRLAAQHWAQSYRHLARQVKGQPRRTLGLLCDEILPWLLDAPGAARVEDTGEEGALVHLPPALPPAYAQGLLEGFLALAGAPHARVAAQGQRFACSWEGPAPAEARTAAALRLLRLPWLAAALVPAMLGAALAWRDGAFDPFVLGLTLLGIALFQLGSNVANDWFDHRSKADEGNHTPTRFSGGSRVIQRGLLSSQAVLALAAGLLAGGVAAGLALALHLQAAQGVGLLELLALGVAGFALGVAYTAPPFRLAHRGLGQLAVGLGFGPLIVAGTYLAQRIAATGEVVVSPAALAFSVPIGALVAAVLLIHEVPDAPWDAAAGKRTLAVRLRGRTTLAYGALLLLAYGSLALAALAFAWPALLALLPAPLAVVAWRRLRRDHAHPWRLLPANALTVALALATGLLLAGALVLARLAFPGV